MKTENGDFFIHADNQTNGLATNLTYAILFLNDQVYNYTYQLLDDIKKTKYYRQEIKRIVNEMYRRMSKYNTYVGTLSPKGKTTFAIITSSIEEDVQRHIEIYKHTVSQVLLKNNVCGDENHLASLASTINVLSQMSHATIVDLAVMLKSKFGIHSNMPLFISVDNVQELSGNLSNYIIKKDVNIDLNAHPEALLAFKALANNLLKHEIFDKAYKEAELYNKEIEQYEER